jgi:ketosteroid isomerase-like protein
MSTEGTAGASAANVGLVRALIEAWNAGDTESIRGAIDRDVFMRSPEDWPESGPFLGRDAVLRAFEQLRETFDCDWHEVITEPLSVGDQVAVRTIWHGEGRGPRLRQESTHVYTVRDGRVVRLEFFADHDEALRAIGAP